MKLHLNGINLKANVWMNGHLIADTVSVVGMFRRFEFNINQWLNPVRRILWRLRFLRQEGYLI